MISDLLLAPTDRLTFSGQGDWQQLLSVLRTHKESTLLVPIGSLADVSILGNYRLQGRWRFTAPALTRYCQAMVPRLAPFVTTMLEDENSTEEDARAVVDIVNRVARARAAKFQGYRWIVDSATARVLGIVSGSFHLTYSFDLLEHVHSYVLQANRLGFFDAQLVHRKVSLRFVGRKPAFSLPAVQTGGDVFHSGFYFANSEVGDAAIKACPLILRLATGAGAVAPKNEEGGSLRHVKMKHFAERLHRLLDSTLVGPQQLKDFQNALLEMRATPLGLPPDGTKQERMLEGLLDRLQTGGLTLSFAKALIGAMVREGSYPADRMKPGGSVVQATARRTFFDLWNALTGEARRQQTSPDREPAENLAFKMLCGTGLFRRRNAAPSPE